jgi:aryl-alcohol dehydrogenase-like predicted oxidoreductase
MWGVAGGEGGWTGSDRDAGLAALHHAVSLGCNFFDTAWIYGRGESERMLGEVVRNEPGRKLFVATKVPPKNRAWPSKRGDRLAEIFPPDHIFEYVDKSLECLGVSTIDLLQFHVWEDEWYQDETWIRTLDQLKHDGRIVGAGISVNRWEPDNIIQTLRTGHIDAVQVIYNIFDQAPADVLFPVCEELDVAVIARVPFDEGSLTGTLNADATWPVGDWRNSYFVPENLAPTLQRVERLRKDIPAGTELSEIALRYILSHPAVDTVIPGMRSIKHVADNMKCSQRGTLTPANLATLATHRWDREPTWWSQ